MSLLGFAIFSKDFKDQLLELLPEEYSKKFLNFAHEKLPNGAESEHLLLAVLVALVSTCKNQGEIIADLQRKFKESQP